MYSSPSRYASPPGYTQIRFSPTPVTPAASKFTYTATPPSKDSFKAHRRYASHGPTTNTYTCSPQSACYASPAGGYYTPTFTVPRQPEFVSPQEYVHSKPAYRAAEFDGRKQRFSQSTKHTTTKPKEYAHRHHAGREASPELVDEGYYSNRSSPSPPSPPSHEHTHGRQVTDNYGHPQVAGQKRSADSPKNKTSSRARATSFTAAQHTTPSSRPRANSKVKTPPKATPADATRARIPAGYSIKNWDPTEEPILLLGSVFDANSLGKWIYDWTVYHHRAATPLSDLAGDLWLLLIQLAGKIKRAEECLDRIRHPDDRDLVEDFLESGERLWDRFGKILKACEEYMWRAASKEAKKKGTNAAASMGARSGCEFVDSIFGRDRKLEDTEKLMTGMRLWSMRFDVNCEAILRNPSG